MAPKSKAKAKLAKTKAKAKSKVDQSAEGEAATAAVTQKGKKARKKEVKEAWLDELGLTLAKQGLRIRTVAADGNCFFRACCDQMQGNEHGHLGLRQEVINFIRSHPDDFAPYMEDEEDFQNYCNRMEKDGAWAGLHEQVALIRLKGKLLSIHQAGQPCWTIRPDFPDVPKDAGSLHLSYHDGEHYNSVRLADDYEDGPALPIPLGSPLKETPAASRGVKAESVEAEKVERVRLGTGCSEEASIVKALRDSNGDADQAIELLVERMAEESTPDQSPSPELKGGPSVATETSIEDAPPPSPATPPRPPPPHAATTDSGVEDLSGEAMQSEPRCPSRADGAVGAEGAVPEEGRDAASREAQDGGVEEPAASKPRPPGRNRPCVCGSGRKYKSCCGAAKAAAERRKKAEVASAANGKPDGAPLVIENLFI